MKRILLGLLLAGACAPAVPPDDPADAPLAGGKGDGTAEPAERGPLEPGTAHALEARAQAFRVESHGGTRLSLEVRGAATTLRVEGPLAAGGEGAAERVIAEGQGEVTLEAPGVYRVVAAGAGELRAECLEACHRTALSARDFLRAARDAGRLEAVLAGADAELARIIPDPELRARLGAELARVAASWDFEGVERFPTVPLAHLGALRPALGQIPAQPPRPDQVVTGELVALLGACDAERELPGPVHPALPDVGYGHFPDRALTRCQVARSRRLAEVLTALGAGNGSEVSYRGRLVRTPSELAGALIAAGHRIEVRNERTYANFISLTAGELDVRWPVWLDTGIVLADGATLAVPMGHSHHAWRVTGPDLDARVMFFLGIDGAGFFAQTQVRPGWTGNVARDVTSDPEVARATLDAAARYLLRNRRERATVAQGMPADGYGFLGVCNDSNAVLELATRGTITTYPLLRAASLDQAAALGDGLDDLLARLPNDGDALPARADAALRILAMTPHPLGSPLFPDARLAAGLAELAAEVGR